MLPKTKFAFSADFHIENNKNLPFVLKTFDWVIDTLKSRNVGHLFILGDFVNSRFKFDILALNKALDVLNNLYHSNIQTYILLGNHERYYKSTNFDITSIKPFEKHSKIINQTKVMHGDGFNFICIPNVETNEEFQQIIKNVELEKHKLNILLAHQGVRGAVTNDLYDVIDHKGVEASCMGMFDRAFLGHFHKRQDIGNILYIGSPVQLSHGEEFSDKGITIWDAETNTTEFIANPHYEVYKTIIDLTEDVKDKFVRYVTKDFLDGVEAKKIKDEILNRGAYDIKIEIKHQEFEEIIKEDVNNFDLKELVMKYVELNCGNLDKDKCHEICLKVMKNEY